jgi:hypothetical protein
MSAAVEDSRAALVAIAELAAAHRLSLDDIAAALAGPADAPDAASRGVLLTRVLAYVGGVFVFAGLGIFIAMQWDAMNTPARIVVTLGSGIACFAMAYIATRDVRLEAAVAPLNVIGAVLQPFGILVVLDAYARGDDWHAAVLLTAGVMLAQQLLAFVVTGRTTLLFSTLVFGTMFGATLLDDVGVSHELTALPTGGSLLLIAMAIQRTRHAAATPFWNLVAAAGVLGAWFGWVQHTPLELSFVAVACGMVFLSTYVRSRSILIVATLGLLGYIGYFTAQRFVNVVGWPLALIGFGLAMIALSAVAVAISRRYIRQAATG